MTTIETQPNEPQAGDLLPLLEAWAASDRATVDLHLARRLAQALHKQPGGALDTFARTGVLDANSALAELNDIRLPLEREIWIDALGQFILEGDRR